MRRSGVRFPRGGSSVKSRDIVNRCPGTLFMFGVFCRRVGGFRWVVLVVGRLVGRRAEVPGVLGDIRPEQGETQYPRNHTSRDRGAA